MMQQFKIGDWVVEIHSKEIHQIIELFPDTCRVKKPLSGITYSTEYTDLKLWQPKEGEWCWFYSSNIEKWYLTKWENSESQIASLWHKNCKPFIGELPN